LGRNTRTFGREKAKLRRKMKKRQPRKPGKRKRKPY